MSWRLYKLFADRYLRSQSRKYGDARVLILVLAFLRDWSKAHKLDFDVAVRASGGRTETKEERDRRIDHFLSMQPTHFPEGDDA